MSTLTIPVPEPVRRLLESERNTHPGLLLDKYAASWSPHLQPDKLSEHVQGPTVREIVKLSQAAPQGLAFNKIVTRRQKALERLEQCRFIKARTDGPLTLHLSRSSALENAGICFHQIYGFVYLPGSGVKGMARAWAETVWKKIQPDDKQDEAQQTIELVFGNKPGEEIEDKQRAGMVVFHDAWPTEWPRLQTDILNSHHSNYYGSEGNKNPPGDWENPIPVNFLSVKRGIPFTFALSLRRKGIDNIEAARLHEHEYSTEQLDQALQLAEQCLISALQHNGAGAKTAAGYGGFKIEESRQTSQAAADWESAATKGLRARSKFPLKLETPAFLAGADQFEATSCDLRESTLRGVLREWWRTMHSSWLSVADLRRLEAALWGDTENQGAIRITIEPHEKNSGPIEFNREEIKAGNRLPDPPNKKTTQGLTYHTYGMAEKRDGRFQRRWYLDAGCSWEITIRVRHAAFAPHKKDDKTEWFRDVGAIEAQAHAAVWLLCQFGGVGAKSRNGFGSMAVPADLKNWTLAQCKVAGSSLRKLLADNNLIRVLPKAQIPDSSSLDNLIDPVEISTSWTNYWYALDAVASAAQSFAQEYKHNKRKYALGVPRNIRQPFTSDRFQFGDYVRDSKRHGSPIRIRLSMDGSKLKVGLIAFPNTQLPKDSSSNQSREFLSEAVTKISDRIRKDGTSGGSSTVKSPKSSGGASGSLPKAGDRIPCVLLETKTKKGGWRAKEPGCGLEGPIQNTGEVPSTVAAGETHDLIVAMCNGKQIAFRWITEAEEKRVAKNKSKGKGPRKGKGRR